MERNIELIRNMRKSANISCPISMFYFNVGNYDCEH